MSEARMEAPQIADVKDAVSNPAGYAAVRDSQHDEHAHGHAAMHTENMKLAMWLFLASEVILFTGLIATYLVFRINNPDVVKEVHETAGVLLVTLNTFLLLTSSWTMVMGLRGIQLGSRPDLIKYISITAILGIVFVVLQGVEYGILSAAGISIGTEFGMRFYAPTAMHGAHVIIGVLWAFFVIHRARKGAYDKNPLGVEMFGLYWHFVDVVWIVLFTVIYLI